MLQFFFFSSFQQQTPAVSTPHWKAREAWCWNSCVKIFLSLSERRSFHQNKHERRTFAVGMTFAATESNHMALHRWWNIGWWRQRGKIPFVWRYEALVIPALRGYGSSLTKSERTIINASCAQRPPEKKRIQADDFRSIWREKKKFYQLNQRELLSQMHNEWLCICARMREKKCHVLDTWTKTTNVTWFSAAASVKSSTCVSWSCYKRRLD